ncbi:uncharacterized protein LOC119556421 [Drosophila subpulchrella]|uniref:uncharacterized protein LOC119556421 n=1 Tax=Drosophila subpulchrella TaxID=1486046 RepID=UPI0018A1B381|nr:uncharacterized protein LOC119556421 [Drosophila subpulchrella]
MVFCDIHSPTFENMLGLRVFFVSNIILLVSFHGKCAVVERDNTLHSRDDGVNNALIEAQSIGRIVNRISNKEVNQNPAPPASYVGDITRASNSDQEHPCPHAPSDIPQINAAVEPKINENPSVTRTEFGSQINSQSTYSSDFQLQIQNTRPVQHIHYHYLVPNTTPKPIVNYVSQSDSNTYNVNFETNHYSTVDSQPSHINGNNLLYTNREVAQLNPLYSAVDNSEYIYDSPDEHQGQASENTSVYEFRDPGEIFIDETQQLTATLKTNTETPSQNQPVDTVIPNPNPPEVYFIKYYDNGSNQTTISPDSQKLIDSSNEVSDGSGLIDIRAGIDEILDSQIKSTTPYNEHSEYNVAIN